MTQITPARDGEPGRATTKRRIRRSPWAAGLFVATASLLGLLGFQLEHANAVSVATQCNGEMNGGGTEVACTVTVVNYLTANGTLSATSPSTVTMTRCVGASGPISTLTCTTVVSTSSEPVTAVQQCNGSGNGGGGAVVCTVAIANHFSGNPAAITPATVYQCVGSVITGTGAPGTCTPANTPGVTSVSEATAGQCNGSGNGGTSVGFVCSVTGTSTTTTSAPVHVDQCNGSGNGGGALVSCQVTVTNDVAAPTVTSTPTAVPTASPSGSPTGSSTSTPSSTPAVTSSPAATQTPPSTPAATATPLTGSSPTTVSTPGNTPVSSPSAPPGPPSTGNTTGHGGRSPVGLTWLFGILSVTIGLGLAGRVVVVHQRRD